MFARRGHLNEAQLRERADRAREFLAVADLHVSGETSAQRATSVSNAVLAAIAASDVICMCRLGEYARGDDHREAIALLKAALPGQAPVAAGFSRLIEAKSLAQYGHGQVSLSETAAHLKRARRVVDSMEDVLRRH